MSMIMVRLLLVMLITVIGVVEISRASSSEETIFIPNIRKDTPNVSRRVNVPYSSNASALPLSLRAIFWFGQVTAANNYADGRIAYTDTGLQLQLNIFDQWLYYDTNPITSELANWDAVTVLLEQSKSGGYLPAESSYKFLAQLSGSGANRANYQAAFSGSSAGWLPATIPFYTITGGRGEGINDGSAARGWWINFEIPFTSLGLSGAPDVGIEWRLAILVHDRDDVTGSPIPIQSWPERADGNSLATWGIIHFGTPTYSHPPASSFSMETIRFEPNGPDVKDAHVGGHSNCGESYNPNFFDGWGDANYAGYDQVNVQNQADVADWPCFSKFYLTFPLDSIPRGKVIVSAHLRLHLFGNSEPSQALISRIQALTVAENWNEADITWNNAPLALENISTTRVEPVLEFTGWPGVPYEWDVSRAVAQAYNSVQPLRLVLYSADGPMHSGKYFSSSDTGNWNQEARPTLEVSFGN